MRALGSSFEKNALRAAVSKRCVASRLACVYHSPMNNTREISISLFVIAFVSFFGCSTTTAPRAYKENPGSEGDGKFTIGPEYNIDRDLTDLGNPKGKYFEFSMRLADSKIFRGDDKTLEPAKKAVRTERKIFVYVPAAYQDGAP